MLLTMALMAAAPAVATCIDPDRVVSRRAEGDDAIRFVMLDGTHYLNRIGAACPGLARADAAGALIIEKKGARLCRGDFVRAARPGDPGVPCVLGKFEAVPADGTGR
ncbi:MAG: hypothetical protein QHC65_13135 [Sphingomonas sp.]|nr:hypothetical protein [Sphingomonas sp.]MDX3885363.1 hypothetical protein [Sphingomonas sp.]